MEVFQVFAGVIRDFASFVLREQPRVNFLLSRLELGSNVVLFSDEDKMACRPRIEIAQEVMHPEAKILQTEFGKIVAVDRVRIEIVFLESFPEVPPLLVFSEKKARRD